MFYRKINWFRIISIIIVLSTISFPLYIGGNYLYDTFSSNYIDIKNYMTKVVHTSTVDR